MGEFYQIQDDFLDCFGEDTDYLGSEIKDGKLNWLAVVFLQRAQPKLIEEFKVIDCVRKVKSCSSLVETKFLNASLVTPRSPINGQVS